MLSDPFWHPDRAIVSDLTAAPGVRVSGPHIHPKATERFHVLRGTVGFTIDGKERWLGPGEYAEVPQGVVHDWCQMGDQEARVVVEVTPGDRFVEVGRTLLGLARDGKLSRSGMPPLLQAAVTMHEYRDIVVMTSPPPRVQRLLFGALAPAGRLIGLRPTYPEHLNDSHHVDDPRTTDWAGHPMRGLVVTGGVVQVSRSCRSTSAPRARARCWIPPWRRPRSVRR